MLMTDIQNDNGRSWEGLKPYLPPEVIHDGKNQLTIMIREFFMKVSIEELISLDNIMFRDGRLRFWHFQHSCFFAENTTKQEIEEHIPKSHEKLERVLNSISSE